MKINKLYSYELRAAHRAAEFIKYHDVLADFSLWFFGLAILLEIFFFAPID